MPSEPKMTKARRNSTSPPNRKPVWADGLKRMYDSVVGEEIPDEFVELLNKLDEHGDQQKP